MQEEALPTWEYQLNSWEINKNGDEAVTKGIAKMLKEGWDVFSTNSTCFGAKDLWYFVMFRRPRQNLQD